MKASLLAWLTLAAIVCVLAGCATMSNSECMAADWSQVGLADGQAGHPLSRLDRHRDACKDTTAVINEPAYQAGRNTGLLAYCTPISGYQAGSKSRVYYNVCPAELAPGFLSGYDLGQQVVEAETDARDADREVYALERELTQLNERLDDAVNRLANADGADAGRIRDELQRLRDEEQLLRRELDLAEFQSNQAWNNAGRVQRITLEALQILVASSEQ